MVVNIVQKGKAKKGKTSDKGKSKGKGSYNSGKGKGKGGDSGKGKGQQKGFDTRKGQQKGYGGGQQQKQKLDVNVCAYRGKSGHWQRDCRKKRADQQQQVRQVGELNDAKHETSVSNASVSTGSGSQAVRLLSAQPCNSSIGHFENLTIHSVPTSPSSNPHGLRVLSDLREFDMAVTDRDGSWTLSPDLRSLNHHFRVVSSMDYMESVMGECDVILDSGANTSALPLCFSDVGIAGPAPDTCFVDAQGTPLNVQATRVANIRFGDVTFRERFIVSDITCPLLSLGSVLRSGWNVMHIDGMPFLTKDDKRIEVLFKNNSLCARGQISVLTERDMPDMQPAVRVVQVGMVLRCLVPGWNRINPHLFATKTTAPKHVDTTLCPSDELMWLRTTLVFREVGGWEVVELCEPIADMRHNLEEEIYDAGSIVEVITLAHKYAMQDEQLGFFMYDRSVANPANFQVDAAESDGYEPSIAPDPQPDEVPVDKLEGEPL
jgi:hypothetical protein